jgi:acyl-homoserine lactone synthase
MGQAVRGGGAMQVEIIRMPADPKRQRLLEENFRLRHQVRIDQEGRQAANMPDGQGVDEFDAPGSVHILIIEGGEMVGGSRLTPLDRPNLLQTAYSGLVQGEFPDHPSLGADWTHYYVLPNRREGGRRTPESAALFSAVMEHALDEGYRFLTFVVPLAFIECCASVGWRITPLGAPLMLGGRPSVAAWIAVNETALFNARLACGVVDEHAPSGAWGPDSVPPSRFIH